MAAAKDPLPPTMPPPGTMVDPTILTTQQTLREVGALREQLEREVGTIHEQLKRDVAGLREIIEARLDGMDKAIELLQTATNRIPSHVDAKVAQLQELHAEKFRSIQVQFSERDTRTEQTSRDSKVAVDAALQAAKEAVGEQNRSSALAIAKSETATMKQIDQQSVLIQTATGGLNDKIDDLKARLGAIEGRTKGQGDSWAVVLGVIGAVVGIAGVAFAIVTAVTRH